MTISNYLPTSTDHTLEFDVAISTLLEVIKRTRRPAGSHRWVQGIDVMGRLTGDLAFWIGVAGDIDQILISKVRFRYQRTYELVHQPRERDKKDRR